MRYPDPQPSKPAAGTLLWLQIQRGTRTAAYLGTATDGVLWRAAAAAGDQEALAVRAHVPSGTDGQVAHDAEGVVRRVGDNHVAHGAPEVGHLQASTHDMLWMSPVSGGHMPSYCMSRLAAKA